jgi:hypothetical protein
MCSVWAFLEMLDIMDSVFSGKRRKSGIELTRNTYMYTDMYIIWRIYMYPSHRTVHRSVERTTRPGRRGKHTVTWSSVRHGIQFFSPFVTSITYSLCIVIRSCVAVLSLNIGNSFPLCKDKDRDHFSDSYWKGCLDRIITQADEDKTKRPRKQWNDETCSLSHWNGNKYVTVSHSGNRAAWVVQCSNGTNPRLRKPMPFGNF